MGLAAKDDEARDRLLRFAVGVGVLDAVSTVAGSLRGLPRRTALQVGATAAVIGAAAAIALRED